ncbi:MAG: signal peptidase I [Nitrospinae bacterium]|nr:signal peptidase I [Nitrospinota bacterium]MZH05742.1 signal peptidase I [Nitrospinota bacterium]MZH15078.1 signal peptidase I [Nitrospinota bacterium]
MTNNTSENTESGTIKRKSVAREYAEAIFIALLLALFIRTFFVQAFKIPSGSMETTLLIGDHILVSKYAYGTHVPNEIPFLNIKLFDDIIFFSKTPERGDIIVFKYPKDEKRDFIKRVIGIPGDLLEVRHQKVFINGKPYEDPHARHTEKPSDSALVPRDDFGPVLVPDGHLFMMGDNRENSQDSRYWGFLDIKKVRGKALMIYWSWNQLESWVRFDRFGKILE